MGAEQIERFLSLQDLSKETGLTVKFLRKAQSQLGLPVYRFGKMIKVKESDFIEWTRKRKTK